MVYFQDPTDNNTATFPKIMTVLGLSMAAANVLLLPLDVAQRGSKYGGIPMDYLWLCVYCIIALLSIILLPFAIFFYEEWNPSKPGQQCGEAVKSTAILFVIIAVLFTVGYIFLGFSDIPISELSSILVPADQLIINCNGPCSHPGGTLQTITFPVSVIMFLIALLSIVGWILFVVFGGIGLIALPVELINTFRERPNPINKTVYEERVVKIGEKAENLMKEGLEVQNEKKTRKEKNHWKSEVWLLISEFERNEVAYKRRGGPIIVYYIKLVGGILGGIVSLLWFIQICIWTNTSFYPFINYMFIAMDGVWQFFGVLFFGIFAYWLLWCVITGNYKWGMRVPLFFTIHPMKANETMLNSLLVNTLLILIASVAVVHVCADSFSEYARNTSINSIFNVTIKYLRGLFWFWLVIRWVLIGIAGLALIYFILRPSDRKKVVHTTTSSSSSKY